MNQFVMLKTQKLLQYNKIVSNPFPVHSREFYCQEAESVMFVISLPFYHFVENVMHHISLYKNVWKMPDSYQLLQWIM